MLGLLNEHWRWEVVSSENNQEKHGMSYLKVIWKKGNQQGHSWRQMLVSLSEETSIHGKQTSKMNLMMMKILFKLAGFIFGWYYWISISNHITEIVSFIFKRIKIMTSSNRLLYL